MCRWLAYSGPSVQLSRIVSHPAHSLIDQSRNSRENVVTTNGDGFGIGWYGLENAAGCYRDTHPAWNDTNLRHLAAHIHSPLFMAHVRAATGTPVQRTNCHPFAFENWLFQHNGAVSHFRKLKRQMLLDVDPELFPHIEGSTDSELLFFLALTFGLRDDPRAALERATGYVEEIQQAAGLTPSLDFSAAISDGKRLFCVRYSSGGDSPTVYHSCHLHSLWQVHGSYEILPTGAIVVVSEPLDELSEHWVSVPESSLVTVIDGQFTGSAFAPRHGFLR